MYETKKKIIQTVAALIGIDDIITYSKEIIDEDKTIFNDIIKDSENTFEVLKKVTLIDSEMVENMRHGEHLINTLKKKINA